MLDIVSRDKVNFFLEIVYNHTLHYFVVQDLVFTVKNVSIVCVEIVNLYEYHV